MRGRIEHRAGDRVARRAGGQLASSTTTSAILAVPVVLPPSPSTGDPGVVAPQPMRLGTEIVGFRAVHLWAARKTGSVPTVTVTTVGAASRETATSRELSDRESPLPDSSVVTARPSRSRIAAIRPVTPAATHSGPARSSACVPPSSRTSRPMHPTAPGPPTIREGNVKSNGRIEGGAGPAGGNSQW